MPGNGGKSQQVNNNVDAQIPPWMMNMRPTTIPAFGPGQQQMLAAQLAQGGFGSIPANMKWLDAIYDPATTYRQAPLPKTPLTPTPKPTDKKPTTTTRTNYYSR